MCGEEEEEEKKREGNLPAFIVLAQPAWHCHFQSLPKGDASAMEILLNAEERKSGSHGQLIV